MPEIRKKVETMEVHYLCDDCSTIIVDKNIKRGNSYVYECPQCKRPYYTRKPYPVLIYKVLENNDK